MDKKDMRYLKWFFIFLTAFFIVLPLLINLWMAKWHITTGPGLGNAEWLGFWGSYIGSIFGVMTTILAFLITYLQNEKQHQQTQTHIAEQNRLSVKPFLEVTQIDDKIEQLDDNKEYDCLDLVSLPPIRTFLDGKHLKSKHCDKFVFLITLSNSGTGAAHQIRLEFLDGSFSVGNIKKDQSRDFVLCFSCKPYTENSTKTHELTIEFCDLIGNVYQQLWKFEVKITFPTYSLQILGISSPRLVTEEQARC